MFRETTIILILTIGVLLLISGVSAADNNTQNTTEILTVPEKEVTTNISTTAEPEISEINPNVEIYKEDNLIAYSAPASIFDNLHLWINDVDYGHSCDLNNKYGVINDVTVKDNNGELVASKNIGWTHLKFTLNGKTTTLTSNEYQSLKKGITVQKYVGLKKTKYVSKYKHVKKTFYKTKLLGKAYKSRIGAIILSKVIGIKKTRNECKHVDKKLNKNVKKQINRMTKKGWKFDYTYKTTKNGIYKIYGEFHKVKKVKKPVYKYKTSNNYMKFKYSAGKYTVSVDSNDNKYVYTRAFALI